MTATMAEPTSGGLEEPRRDTLACQRVNPEVFFAEDPAEIEYAKALCTDCPVRSECLALALDNREVAGVWGGELIERGRIVARKRPRGRPPKNPAPLEMRIPATGIDRPAGLQPGRAAAPGSQLPETAGRMRRAA